MRLKFIFILCMLFMSACSSKIPAHFVEAGVTWPEVDDYSVEVVDNSLDYVRYADRYLFAQNAFEKNRDETRKFYVGGDAGERYRIIQQYHADYFNDYLHGLIAGQLALSFEFDDILVASEQFDSQEVRSYFQCMTEKLSDCRYEAKLLERKKYHLGDFYISALDINREDDRDDVTSTSFNKDMITMMRHVRIKKNYSKDFRGGKKAKRISEELFKPILLKSSYNIYSWIGQGAFVDPQVASQGRLREGELSVYHIENFSQFLIRHTSEDSMDLIEELLTHEQMRKQVLESFARSLRGEKVSLSLTYEKNSEDSIRNLVSSIQLVINSISNAAYHYSKRECYYMDSLCEQEKIYDEEITNEISW